MVKISDLFNEEEKIKIFDEYHHTKSSCSNYAGWYEEIYGLDEEMIDEIKRFDE